MVALEVRIVVLLSSHTCDDGGDQQARQRQHDEGGQRVEHAPSGGLRETGCQQPIAMIGAPERPRSLAKLEVMDIRFP